MARGGRWGGGGGGGAFPRRRVHTFTKMDACLTLSDLHFCSGFDACARL